CQPNSSGPIDPHPYRLGAFSRPDCQLRLLLTVHTLLAALRTSNVFPIDVQHFPGWNLVAADRARVSQVVLRRVWSCATHLVAVGLWWFCAFVVNLDVPVVKDVD